VLDIADRHVNLTDTEMLTSTSPALTARPTEQGGYLSDIDTPGEA